MRKSLAVFLAFALLAVFCMGIPIAASADSGKAFKVASIDWTNAHGWRSSPCAWRLIEQMSLNWLSSSGAADLNHDGSVNLQDFALIASNWLYGKN